jgi:hypothetical protein
MRKIPTLFRRDLGTHRIQPQVSHGCEWVLDGEGRATRKWDGTACLVDRGVLYRRLTLNEDREAPKGFRLVEVQLGTGKRIGWAPLEPGPAGHWHREAWADLHATLRWFPSGTSEQPSDGTYELVGPKINGNPDGFSTHRLIKHGWATNPVELADLDTCPREYHALGAWLLDRPYEGVVWHHPDGRMAKLKKRDYLELRQPRAAA